MSYYKGSSYGGSRGGYRGGSSSYRGGGGGGGNDSSWRGGRGGSSFSSSRTVSSSSGGGGGSSRYYPSSPPSSYESRSRSSYVGGTSATDRYSSRRDESYNRYPEMSSYSSREYGRGSSPEPPRKRVRADSPSYIDLPSPPPNTKRYSSEEEQINTRKSKKPLMAGVDNEIHQKSANNMPLTNTTLTFSHQRKEIELNNSLRKKGHFVSLDNKSEKSPLEISSYSSASNKEFKKTLVQGNCESVSEGKYESNSVPLMNSLNTNELWKIISSETRTEQVQGETSKKSLPENQRRMLEKLTNLMGCIHEEIDKTCATDRNNSGDKVWCEELKGLITKLESTVTKKIVQSSSAPMMDPIIHNEISAGVSKRLSCLALQNNLASDVPLTKSNDQFFSETNRNSDIGNSSNKANLGKSNLQEEYIKFLGTLGDGICKKKGVSFKINNPKSSVKLSRADKHFELKSNKCTTSSDACVQGSTEIIQSGTSKKRLPGAQIRRLKKLAKLLGCTYEEIYKMCVIDCSNTGDEVWCEDLKNLVTELEDNTRKNINLSSSLDLQNDLANDVTTQSRVELLSKAKESHQKDILSVRNNRPKQIPPQCLAKTHEVLNKSSSELLSVSPSVSSNSVNTVPPHNVNFKSNTKCSTQSNQLAEQKIVSTDLEQALAGFFKEILEFQKNNRWVIKNQVRNGATCTIKCCDWESYSNLQLKISELEKLYSDANFLFNISADFTKFETTFSIFDFLGRPIKLLQGLKYISKLDCSEKDKESKSVKVDDTLINFSYKDSNINEKSKLIMAKERCKTNNRVHPNSGRIIVEGNNNIDISIKQLDGDKTVIPKSVSSKDSIVIKSTIVENAETVPVENDPKTRRKKVCGSQKRRLKKLRTLENSRIQLETTTQLENSTDCTNSNSLSITDSTSNMDYQQNEKCLTHPEQQNRESTIIPSINEITNQIQNVQHNQNSLQNRVLTVIPTVNLTNRKQNVQHNQISLQNRVVTVIPTVDVKNK